MPSSSDIIGLDVGKANSGIARASAVAKLAEPLISVPTNNLIDGLRKLIDGKGISTVVVGLPRNIAGKDTDQTRWVRHWVKNAQRKLPEIEFYWQDESLTTQDAQAINKKYKNRYDEHALAAALILQDFLDMPEDQRQKVARPSRLRLIKVRPKRGKGRLWLIMTVILLLLAVGGVVGLRGWYQHNLRPVSTSEETVYFTVEQGASLHQIAVGLKKTGLIRSTTAFEYYVRTNELYNNLQAGTYSLSASMSAQAIVDKIVKGDITKNLVTILPGKRLAQIKEAFTKADYSQSEVEEAFSPQTYGGLPALSSLPAGATLEGYVYPDSFQKDANTPASWIVRQSLNQFGEYLTPEVIEGFKAQGLSTYQGITLASVVYRETDDPKFESTVAQVFLTRLRQNMPLESDATAHYGADIAGVARSLDFDSAYNTYLHPGLPPGPISNFTADALKAVAFPAKTDYLYFVAGDDGTVHFSHTLAEHEAATARYCTTQCGR